ncbi:hypothetical protein GRI39_12975 [Altererythrobacter indicus]|uniref:Uncharacterized protein n=1 Tax=Altericroceibacterium indicum TaxID=374177 RepID=A0A845AEH1_9SPHN|nr:hypothetical protein [Altericroceibacterium indicum]MXP26946.1 hypothetical protein [Altericroceibacterium indicum]
MPTSSVVFSTLALMGGVLTLRLAWGQPQRRVQWLCAVALALFAAVFFALQATSVELAVAILSVAVSVPAYILVVTNATRRPRVSPRVRTAAADGQMVSTRLALRWVGAGPCALAASVAGTAGAAIWLPGNSDLRLILAILLFPLLWATLGGWVLGSEQPTRLSAAMVLVSGLAAIAIAFRFIG